MVGLEKKLTLYGFNNLTKTLSFNIFDVCYAKSEREKQDYIRYIDEQYNSERLTNILCDVTEMIGAAVLNISRQDYEPQGASVNVLISEGSVAPESIDPSCNQGDGFLQRRDIHAHLDKSHVTVHTFPESHPDNEVTTFRVDLDVSTCGEISPLNTLDYLKKGGRCTSVQALGANLLGLKPCIEVIGGKMTVGKKYRGKIEAAYVQYIKDRLAGRDDIDTRRVFITDSGLPDDVRARLREVVLSCQPFEEVYNNRAGCTISGHCGPWCMGVLYYHKYALRANTAARAAVGGTFSRQGTTHL